MSSDDDDDLTSLPSPTKDGTSASVMSMFSSYYDIAEEKEPNEIEAESNVEPIDTVHFDATSYVRDLLESSSIESLVNKDRRMVQEIRAIDSDLQMLVYENYAKFISATDTIKRMKTNVEAMDDDMTSVLDKMTIISTNSLKLDSILESTRGKVDKLVRIKRLLERLQFLSILPESLSKLIHNEEYKDAIVLYKKTISILKNHSDILSFKNIQERTENMMTDLRNSVLNLLNNVNVECSKLTHYISILRLLETPKDQVMIRFVHAHSERANNIHAAINIQIKEGDVVDVFILSQYHQSLLDSLLESTRGFLELYNGSSDGPDVVTSFVQLASMIGTARDSCKDIVATALQAFLVHYDDMLRVNLVSRRPSSSAAGASTEEQHLTEAKGVTEDENVANPFSDTSSGAEDRERDDRARYRELEDHRRQWLAFARQAIIGWQIINSSLRDCVSDTVMCDKTDNGHELDEMKIDCLARCRVSDVFSDAIAGVLEKHRSVMMSEYADQCMAVFGDYVRDITVMCNVRENGDAQIETTMRNVLSRKCSESKSKLDTLIKALYSILGDVCSSSKLVFDVLCVRETSESLSSLDASTYAVQFMQDLVHRFEKMNNLMDNIVDDGSDVKDMYNELCVEEPVIIPASVGVRWNESQTLPLASALLLKKMASGLIRRVSAVLVEHDMTGRFTSDSSLQSAVIKRLNGASYRCLLQSVDKNCSALSHRIRLALVESCVAADENKAGRSFISADVINVALQLDVFAVSCCVILSEPPFPFKLFTVERELHKRNVSRKSRGIRSSSQGFHQDISRLFTSKVDIFKPDQITLSIESIFKVAVKSLLKTCVETSRELSLSSIAHFQLASHIFFLRQACAVIIQTDGFNEAEDLGEQAVIAADSRCEDPDAVPEGLSIVKVVTDGLAALSNQPTLFQR